MSDPMTPDMHTAALQGLANNPLGQLYATAYQAGERAGAQTLGETTAVQAYGIGYQDGATLSMIVRDLMDAAGYPYSPDRPLAEQTRECCYLIREHQSQMHRIHRERTNDRAEHEAEAQRLTDLTDELRKQLAGADRHKIQLQDRALTAEARVGDLERMLASQGIPNDLLLCGHSADRIDNDEVTADEHQRLCVGQATP